MDVDQNGQEHAEFDIMGARAVTAASVEQKVIQEAEGDAAFQPDVQGDDITDLQSRLRAVRREVRAVRSEATRLREFSTAEEHHEEGLPTSEGVLAVGELQQAVMQQRLAELHKQEEHLEASLKAAGVAPEALALPPEALHEVLATLQHGKNGSSKRKTKVQFEDMQEQDIFDAAEAAADAARGIRGPSLVETERDRLIRLGVLTPFDRLDGFERRMHRSLAGNDDPDASIARVGEKVRALRERQHTSKLMDPSELPRRERAAKRVDEGFWRAGTSQRVPGPKKRRTSTLPRATPSRRRLRRRRDSEQSEAQLRSNRADDPLGAQEAIGGSGSDSSNEEAELGEELADSSGAELSLDEPNAANESASSESNDELLDARGQFDDADDVAYAQRQLAYQRQRARGRRRGRSVGQKEAEEDDVVTTSALGEDVGVARNGGVTREPNGSRRGDDGTHELLTDEQEQEEEEEEPADVSFEGGYSISGELYARLFPYQRTAVKWMWELHTQRAGGIIADEMGLGKTIQVIAFLAGLHRSGMFRPSLIVCPATVLNQWLRELRAWYPPFRVAILHESAGRVSGSRSSAASRSAIIQRIASSEAGILLTSYDQLRLQRAELLPIRWGYAVLDEGHKIRNPDAEVTLTAKQLATVHRIIMTGSPIQNRLTELWSLFDFVFPGKLGTLPVFQAQFTLPIQLGGYANASPLQVSAAYKCSVVLRDLISPYLLRRRKADVATSLPRKTERVLFCSLSKEQREMYRSYLASKELSDILAGNRGALAGIDILRKICNHPDLLERARWEAALDYGNPVRSGKLSVLRRLLEHWHAGTDEHAGEPHKVLVFTQTQQVLDILERMVESEGWRYHRMDGLTSISQRARLIDDFNNNPDVFVFLLTTRVGGLGVNLTAANRCVIFDPDWNPSTDVQARERAWRIGQSREVAVYRLITSGTIEEKVYHRQVYKQFLTDRVLRDPRQRRFFKARDLSDLFTLGEEYAEGTETGDIFATLGTEIDIAQAAGEPSSAADEEMAAADAGDGAAIATTTSENAMGGGDDSGNDGEDRVQPELSKSKYSSSVVPSSRKFQRIGEHGVHRGSPNNGIASAQGDGETQILRDLLDGAGVHAAIDHDKIEGAHRPEHRMAQKEAEKIAARAAEALRRSRLSVQRAPVTQPTWTGRSGGAGAPRPRFGAAVNPRLALSLRGGENGRPINAAETDKVNSSGLQMGVDSGRGGAALTSAALLARLRERQASAVAASAAEPDVAHAQVLAQRIAAYLHGRGGSAPSGEVVSAFQGEVTVGDVALFRGVLRQVATLQRRQGSGKVWALRPEFVSAAAAAAVPQHQR